MSNICLIGLYAIQIIITIIIITFFFKYYFSNINIENKKLVNFLGKKIIIIHYPIKCYFITKTI